LPLEYYYNTLDEKQQEVPETNIYMNNVFSSRLTAIIQNNNDTTKQFSVVPLNQYIDSATPAKINSKNPQEVQIKLNTSLENIVDVLDNTSNDKNHSEIYIVQNYDQLINYLTYILQFEYNFKNPGSQSTDTKKQFSDVNDYIKNNGNGEDSFYNDYNTNSPITSTSQTVLQNINTISNYGYNQVTNSGGKLTIDDTSYNNDVNLNTDALLYLTSKIKSASDKEWDDPTTTTNYNFLKKYVIACGQADKKTPSSESDISASSFLKIIPDKDPTNTKELSNFQ
jgi:hypothetical protein